jgi:hypothetical protein
LWIPTTTISHEGASLLGTVTVAHTAPTLVEVPVTSEEVEMLTLGISGNFGRPEHDASAVLVEDGVQTS